MNQPCNLYQIAADDLEAMIDRAVTKAMNGIIEANKPEAPTEYMTGADVCQLLHIVPVTLVNWRNSGKIKAYKVGRRVLYRKDEVEAALSEMTPLKYKRVRHGRL